MTFLLPDSDDTWDEAFISAAFVSWHTEPSDDGSYIPMTEQEAQETFDRWLNEERAKAWSEGYADGQDSIYTSTNEWPNPDIRNPYRKVEE